MRPVKCDGKLVGWANVTEDGRVTSLDLEEGFMLSLPKGEHEVRIELDSTLEEDQKTGEYTYVVNYLSSKFTL